MVFAGFPTATPKAGTSLVTTALAPIIAPSPMVTPPRIDAFSPIHTLFSIITGPFECKGRFEGGSIRNFLIVSPCELSVISILLPVKTFSPMIILLIAVICA